MRGAGDAALSLRPPLAACCALPVRFRHRPLERPRCMAPRIALLGFSIECNRFAPIATEADFVARTLLAGDAMLSDARAPAPRMLGELPGFVAAMDAGGLWRPVPILLAMAEPNGPVDQRFFDALLARWEAGLRDAGPLDGVYCVLHGAGLTTGGGDDPHGHDPEGVLLALVRRVVGASVPVVATFDLHANISDADVAPLDAFIGYRTNPHLDMRARGAEAATLLHRLCAGTRTHIARIRLPIVPPTVTQLTGADAPNRPYGELIDLGQQRMAEPPYAGRVLNVSVMGGFAFADTPFNGLTAVVTATDAEAAQGLAHEIAEAGWARRARFRPSLTSLEDATALALGTADLARHALAFADVADNPGGGGRGNTMSILQAFHEAGVHDALVGVIHDPALAAEAHRQGEGARFLARFNRDGGDAFGKPFAAAAEVARLLTGTVCGRRGIYADNTLDLGQAAALDLDGITVVVLSNRYQCADPVFFEAFGLDIAAARIVVVKSRGHFRGGFDEFFRHQDIIEVDAPGLTSPILSRFDWRFMPRPVIPIDDTATWMPPA
jgi:microcystin degradation protein MlrC